MHTYLITGTRLRECDEALLQEEEEAYTAALRDHKPLDDAQMADSAAHVSSSSYDMQQLKHRRLARIKALLSCKAATMTRHKFYMYTYVHICIYIHTYIYTFLELQSGGHD
jgi:hypothetical protein